MVFWSRILHVLMVSCIQMSSALIVQQAPEGTAPAPQTTPVPAPKAPPVPKTPAPQLTPAAKAPSSPPLVNQPPAGAQPGAAPGLGPAPPTVTAATIFSSLLGALIFASCIGVVAYYYKKHKLAENKYLHADDFREYKTGIFDCFDDLPRCCFAVNCPWIFWADTISSVKTQDSANVPILSFWTAFALLVGIQVFSSTFSVVGANLIGWFVFACVIAYYRRSLRSAFGMEADNKTCFEDLCCACWCGILVIAQDARHVEQAKKQKHKAMLV